MFTTEEVKAILRTLPVGKAVGPDGNSNRILHEPADELSTPFPLYSISPYTKEMSQCAL